MLPVKPYPTQNRMKFQTMFVHAPQLNVSVEMGGADRREVMVQIFFPPPLSMYWTTEVLTQPVRHFASVPLSTLWGGSCKSWHS
jgi:hypothetical protein